MPVQPMLPRIEAKLIVQNAEIRCYRMTIVCSTITAINGEGFTKLLAGFHGDRVHPCRLGAGNRCHHPARFRMADDPDRRDRSIRASIAR
jgi:hypothetical protein